ncbi:hypothetical protein E2I00_010169 [Balaenoptera physalus]|uniref:MHD domain-containing protein n=1 Tax=Balaenoptera physalus TaxID=9770 RepID=A0A6A1QGG2_BALPH|nr:hypothetical protein E2I00_010169 [Balaenoptera physalus]
MKVPSLSSTSTQVLICRNYRGDVDMSEVEHFMPILMEKEEEGMLSPILAHGGVRFMWIKHNNLYRIPGLGCSQGAPVWTRHAVVATSKKNACVSLVFSFLYKVVQAATAVLLPTFPEPKASSIALWETGKRSLWTKGLLAGASGHEGLMNSCKRSSPPRPSSQRSAPHATPQVFSEYFKELEEESIRDNFVSANGNVLRSEIVGSIKMRVFLSGMPELRLGLNDKVLFDNTGRGKSKSVELEDVKFHQCVRLSRFENDRTISFIPPDGEFELMSYRLNTHVKPLIWIESVIEKHSHSRIEYMIKAKSQFKRRSTANNVEIHIPVPNDADSPKFKTTVGSVKWVPENSEIVWSIKSFPGGKEYLMRAHFGLPSVEAEDKEGKPPISVKFEIPYFTTSGIQVRYLKIIEKSGYQALPWVRYITQNGDYQLRTQ